MLEAPLDWPDCCALCSDNNGGDGAAAIGAACAAWSFDPSSGSCQRISAVVSTSRDESWGANGTVHGYPGVYEGPIGDCWGRTQHGLCVNTNAVLIIPGLILAFFGLWCVYCHAFRLPSKRTGLLRQLLADPKSSRLVKAACVEVMP